MIPRGELRSWLRASSPSGRAVLLLLWTYADTREREPSCWPAAVSLADLLGLDERNVRRALAALVELGAISRFHNGRRLVWRLHRSASANRALPPPVDPPMAQAPDETGRSRHPDPGAPAPRMNQDQPMNNQPTDAPTEPRQLQLESPEIQQADPAFALWGLQEKLRREASPKARGLRATPERLRRVRARLAENSLEDCEHVLRVYAAEAKRAGSIRWLNGVTNWRPDNFLRALSSTVDETRDGYDRPGDGEQLDGAAARGLELVEGEG